MSENRYHRPEVKDLGSVRELTQGTFNKIGSTPDIFTAVTNGAVIGSVVASP